MRGQTERQNERRLFAAISMIVFLVIVAVSLGTILDGCAAQHTLKAKLQVSALTTGEAVLSLDQTEYALYSASLYDKAMHDKLGEAILKILYVERAYERAVAGWPDSFSKDTPPPDVLKAEQALLAALADFEHLLPAAENIRTPLFVALEAIRATLTALGTNPPAPTRSFNQRAASPVLGTV